MLKRGFSKFFWQFSLQSFSQFLMRFSCKALLLLVLLGCTDDDFRLPGVREDLFEDGLQSRAVVELKGVKPTLSSPIACGYVATTIRQGNCLGGNKWEQISSLQSSPHLGYNNPLFADPLFVGDHVYVLDVNFAIRKINLKSFVEETFVTLPVSFEDSDAIGGGLALEGSNLIAALGTGQLFALDIDSLEIKWEANMLEPTHVTPLLADGRIFVKGLYRSISAYDISSGLRLWSKSADTGDIAYLQSAKVAYSKAVAGKPLVFVVFASGEIQALRPASGLPLWSESLKVTRRDSLAIADWVADPIVVDDSVLVSNGSGGITLIDSQLGKRVWWNHVSLAAPAWVSGDVVFGINTEAQLFAMDLADGKIYWTYNYPKWTDEKKNRIVPRFGPILFGGMLVVVGRDGAMRAHDPMNGKVLWEKDFGVAVAAAPSVAGNRVYIPLLSGRIMVFE